MTGNGDIAFGKVFLASQRFRKDRRQQIIGTHALDRRRNLLSVAKTEQSQSAARIPTPACCEERRNKHSLLQDGAQGIGVKKMKDVGKRKAVLLAEIGRASCRERV